MHTVRQIGIVQSGRNKVTLVYVLSTGDDLNVLTRTAIDLTDKHMVRVGVTLHFSNLTDNYVTHRLGKVDHFLDLKACHNHFVTKLLYGNVYINISFKPT